MIANLQSINNKPVKNIHSILVIDANGCLLGAYTATQNDTLDENLVSMFISALSNFSKELFNKHEEATININRGDYSIYLESNEKLCTAIIGEEITEEHHNKLRRVLNSVNNLYKYQTEPSSVDYENEIQYIINKIFEFK